MYQVSIKLDNLSMHTTVYCFQKHFSSKRRSCLFCKQTITCLNLSYSLCLPWTLLFLWFFSSVCCGFFFPTMDIHWMILLFLVVILVNWRAQQYLKLTLLSYRVRGQDGIFIRTLHLEPPPPPGTRSQWMKFTKEKNVTVKLRTFTVEMILLQRSKGVWIGIPIGMAIRKKKHL